MMVPDSRDVSLLVLLLSYSRTVLSSSKIPGSPLFFSFLQEKEKKRGEPGILITTHRPTIGEHRTKQTSVLFSY